MPNHSRRQFWCERVNVASKWARSRLLERPTGRTDSSDQSAAASAPPKADHHTHIWSETAAAILASQLPTAASKKPDAVTADQLIAELDAASVRRAAVLSVAYWFDSPLRVPEIEEEYAKVRAENDWVAAQAARYPDRLAAFFSFNPLKDHALDEIERCTQNQRFKGA